MAAVLFQHAVGDLTLGKPKLQEFPDNGTVGEALEALQAQNHFELPIFRPAAHDDDANGTSRRSTLQERFVGMLDMIDIIGHMASGQNLQDAEGALSISVAEIVIPNNTLLRQVAAGTRLFDALDLMRQGVRQLLVPIVCSWRSVSKRFSMVYYSKWRSTVELDVQEEDEREYCVLTREDLVRFLIGCMGALAPMPLMSIEALGMVRKPITTLEAGVLAREVLKLRRQQDVEAIAVVDRIEDGGSTTVGWRIVGEISAFKLKRCNYREAAHAMAEATALEFVIYVGELGPMRESSSKAELRNQKLELNFELQEENHDPPSLSLPPPSPQHRKPFSSSSSTPSLSPSPSSSLLLPTPSPSPSPQHHHHQHSSSNPGPPPPPSIPLPNPPLHYNHHHHSSLSSSSPSPSLPLPTAPLHHNHLQHSSPSSSSPSPSLPVPPPSLQHLHHQYASSGGSSANPRPLRRWMEPMTCRADVSLAAVMAQLLTYRANHTWVTDERGGVQGLVSYAHIFEALVSSSSSSSFASSAAAAAAAAPAPPPPPPS